MPHVAGHKTNRPKNRQNRRQQAPQQADLSPLIEALAGNFSGERRHLDLSGRPIQAPTFSDPEAQRLSEGGFGGLALLRQANSPTPERQQELLRRQQELNAGTPFGPAMHDPTGSIFQGITGINPNPQQPSQSAVKLAQDSPLRAPQPQFNPLQNVGQIPQTDPSFGLQAQIPLALPSQPAQAQPQQSQQPQITGEQLLGFTPNRNIAQGAAQQGIRTLIPQLRLLDLFSTPERRGATQGLLGLLSQSLGFDIGPQAQNVPFSNRQFSSPSSPPPPQQPNSSQQPTSSQPLVGTPAPTFDPLSNVGQLGLSAQIPLAPQEAIPGLADIGIFSGSNLPGSPEVFQQTQAAQQAQQRAQQAQQLAEQVLFLLNAQQGFTR